MDRAYRPIDDYGLIGDSRGAALVSGRGSVDWLCAPRLDSPSVFNALLDHWRGGFFSVTPAGPFTTARRYLPETCVLETEFRAPGGRARLTDFCPALHERDKRGRLLPLWSLVRIVEALDGELALEVVYKPRPMDGALAPAVERLARGAAVSRFADTALVLAHDGELALSSSGARGLWRLRSGERRTLWLSLEEGQPAVIPALGEAPALLEATAAYWREWAARCSCPGPRRAAVLRSALTLKLLSFAPSGAVAAVPTTSLPEALGGSRNWDYRSCWLRDASLTARVFAELGYREESTSFIEWMMYATTRTHPELKVFYDLYGEHSQRERAAPFLEGYAHSGPARLGNDAQGQYQLDVYGEVLQSVRRHVEDGAAVDGDLRRLVRGLGDYVAENWTRPDHGIWEMRLARKHFTHSKLMCWLALEHAGALARRLDLKGDFARWSAAQRSLREAIERRAWSSAKASFTQAFGSEHLDATALLMPVVGFLEPGDARAVSTIDAVRRELARGELVYRYRRDDGLPGKEGAFVACGYWLAGALGRVGRLDEAWRQLEALERRRSDLGLMSEEIDPETGAALGNFPQAFSHMTHARAVLLLERLAGGSQRSSAPSSAP